MERLTKLPLYLALPALCLAATPAFAQQPETPPATVTMQILAEGEDPDEIIERIELPTDASAEGVEASRGGLDTASAARADGRAFGEAVADEARQRGGDEAADSADQARANARDQIADDMARGDLDDLPEQVRENIPEEAQERIRQRGRGRPGDGGI